MIVFPEAVGYDPLYLIIFAAVWISIKFYEHIDSPINYYTHPTGEPIYLNDESCIKIIRCKYCGKEKHFSEKHISFSNWNFLDVDSCIQQRICNRCGYKENRDPSHDWKEWQYKADKDDSCMQQRVCSRCGYKENRGPFHDWEEWQYEEDKSCIQIRICKRDGVLERTGPVHDWGEWNHKSNDSFQMVRKCQRCGFEEKTCSYCNGSGVIYDGGSHIDCGCGGLAGDVCCPGDPAPCPYCR